MTPLVTISVPAYRAIDYKALVESIAAVETRRNKPQGVHGERGPLQFKAESWAEDADGLSFHFALDPALARWVATRRLKRLAKLMRERGIEPSCYKLGIAWNSGLSNVLLFKWVNADVRDYAIRVENLYTDRLKHAPALSPQPSTISP